MTIAPVQFADAIFGFLRVQPPGPGASHGSASWKSCTPAAI